MDKEGGPVSRRPTQPTRNHAEAFAVDAIDQKQRFASFVALLVWQFGRRNRRRKKLLAVFRDLTRGVGIGEPGSSMEGSSCEAREQARARLLKALEDSARTLAHEEWLPAVHANDFARFADAVHQCRRKRHEELTSEQLLDGFATLVGGMCMRAVAEAASRTDH